MEALFKLFFGNMTVLYTGVSVSTYILSSYEEKSNI